MTLQCLEREAYGTVQASDMQCDIRLRRAVPHSTAPHTVAAQKDFFILVLVVILVLKFNLEII